MMRAVLMVTFGGKQMSLIQAAKLAGLSEYCVRRRYQKGERGDDLFRLPSRGRSRDELSTNPQVEALRAKQEVREAVERAKKERKLARQQREQEARARAMAEHAKAFARPLIDAKLLKPREHLAILERVKNCGQRCWRKDGGATF